jgi:hypothetical protein
VYEDEVGLSQLRVVDGGFQKLRVAVARDEVRADARARVKMNGEAEASGFARNVAEEEVL